MKVLVSGASGLVGTALLAELRRRGDEIIRLRRRRVPGADADVLWDPVNRSLDPGAIEGIDAAIHLSGEPLVEGRWSAGKKKRILVSREGTTSFLSSVLASLDQKPRVLVSSSAVGYYGDQGADLLSEDSPQGTGFLADVCGRWEAAANAAREAGIRVVHARSGVALSKSGGALAKLLPPFRMGVGGPLGSGNQYISWISMDDLVLATLHMVDTEELRGPVNAVSPNPVTNKDFARELGAVLNRPAAISVPAIAARLAAGEMADEVLLASQRVEPVRLIRTGFAFRYPSLRRALERALE